MSTPSSIVQTLPLAGETISPPQIAVPRAAPHVIETLHWECHFADRTQAERHQQRLSRFLNGPAQTVIQNLFERLSPPGEVWRIEHLQVDLGELSPTATLDQWAQNLHLQLSTELLRARAQTHERRNFALAAASPLSAKSAKSNKDAVGVDTTNAPTAPAELLPGSQRELDQFLFYLRHGHLPWSMSAVSGRDIASWLARLAYREGTGLWRALQQLFPPERTLRRLSHISPYHGLHALIAVRHRELAWALNHLDEQLLLPLQARGRLSAYQLAQLRQQWRVAALETVWSPNEGSLSADRLSRLARRLSAVLDSFLGSTWRAQWRWMLAQQRRTIASTRGNRVNTSPTLHSGFALQSSANELLSHLLNFEIGSDDDTIPAATRDDSKTHDNQQHQAEHESEICGHVASLNGCPALISTELLSSSRAQLVQHGLLQLRDLFCSMGLTADVQQLSFARRQALLDSLHALAPFSTRIYIRYWMHQRRIRTRLARHSSAAELQSLLKFLHAPSTHTAATHDIAIDQTPPMRADHSPPATTRLASETAVSTTPNPPANDTVWYAVTCWAQTNHYLDIDGTWARLCQHQAPAVRAELLRWARQRRWQNWVSQSWSKDRQTELLGLLAPDLIDNPVPDIAPDITQYSQVHWLQAALNNAPAANEELELAPKAHSAAQALLARLADPDKQEAWLDQAEPLRWRDLRRCCPTTFQRLRATSETLFRALQQLVKHGHVVFSSTKADSTSATSTDLRSTMERAHWRFLIQTCVLQDWPQDPATLARRYAMHLRHLDLDRALPNQAKSAASLLRWQGRLREALDQITSAASTLQTSKPPQSTRDFESSASAAMSQALHLAPRLDEQWEASLTCTQRQWLITAGARSTGTDQPQRHPPPPRAPQASQRPASDSGSDSASNSTTEVPELPHGEPIHIANAGLVLLSIHLPRLLHMLEATRDNHFISQGQRHLAVHALAYLNYGHTEGNETQWMLNKLLCGIPLSEPIPPCIEIPLHQREMMDGLLKAIITHWKALGNTTVIGLREAFFQREGRLLYKPNGSHPHWQLRVQHRAYDLLLDRLPWQYQTIKLPWMPEVLHVEWR